MLRATLERGSAPTFDPLDISGCNVWLDADQLTGADGSSIGSQWSDLSGAGHHGMITASPSPTVRTNMLNGKRVVRFRRNQGFLRGDTGLVGTAAGKNFSVFYIARMIGPLVGRVFSGAYPTVNFLVGYYSGGQDVCYDNGYANTETAWGALPTPWRTWGFTASYNGTTYDGDFYIDGVASGNSPLGGGGLQSRYHLSGFGDATYDETCDCEVAELICYNRKLSDSERVQVQNYLNEKWFGAGFSFPVTVALSGNGVLSATASQKYGPAAALTGDGVLSAATMKKAPVDAALSGGGALSATAVAATPPAGVTYGSTGVGKTNNLAATYNWTHNIVGDAILVGTLCYQGALPTMSATCGGVAMTVLYGPIATGATNTYVTVFGLLNPPTGSQTVAVSSTGAFNSADSVSYDGVGSFGTPAFKKGAAGTAMAHAVPSTSDQMVFQVFTGYSNPAWSAYNKTARYSDGYEASGNMAIHIGDAVGDPALNFTITPSTSVLWSSTAIPINGGS